MAFDAFFLTAVLEEVRARCIGARVDKLHQPSRDTLIFHLRCQLGREKLLFVANPTAPRLPQGGTALFAMLAMAGDLGGAFGPSLVGTVSQLNSNDLHSGMLAGSVFPLVLIVALTALLLQSKKSGSLPQG